MDWMERQADLIRQREEKEALAKIQDPVNKESPRPERVTCEQVPMGDRFPLTHRMVPQKWRDTLEQNQEIKLCCRHMENMSGQLYKTSPKLAAADLMTATCSKCGCIHKRWFVGEHHPNDSGVRR